MHSGHQRTGQLLSIAGAGLATAYGLWRMARRATLATPPNGSQGPHIVVLGAGFGGRDAVVELARQLPRPRDATITLVDQRGYLLFTPMLTEVAGGELNQAHIVSAVRHLSPRVAFIQGNVDSIDLQAKQVSITLPGDDGVPATRTLQADHLIIALGSVPNYHHIPGLDAYALTMKSLPDAVAVRRRVREMLERANAEPDAERRRELLCFVVGGAGFTGVETMAAITGLLRDSIRDYPHISMTEVSMLLVDPGKRILPELDADLAAYARRKLEQHGVHVRLNTAIVSVGKEHVEIGDQERISTRTLIWAGGVMPAPVIHDLPCKHGKHGGIAVDRTCAVPGFPGVWAVGDCAEVPMQSGDKAYPPTAQNATREGIQAARNIVAVLHGEQPQPFDWKPIGELALVGKHSGVAQIYKLKFSGRLAWAMWRLVYLSKLPDPRQRVRVLLDWILDSIFGRPLVEVGTEAPVQH